MSSNSSTIPAGEKLVSDGYHVPEPLKEYSQDIWVLWAPDEGKKALAPWQEEHMYPCEWAVDKDVNPRVDYEKAESFAALSVTTIHETWPFPDDDNLPSDVKPAVLLPPMWTDDPLTFIDYDEVRDPETKCVSTEVYELLREFGGPVEISQSGTGLHQWVYGELPDGLGKFIADLDSVGSIEMYDHSRMTGGTWKHVRSTSKDTIPNAQETINTVVNEYATAEHHARMENSDAKQESRTPEEVLSLLADVNEPNNNSRSPYFELDLKQVADQGPFASHRKRTKTGSSNWQGPHPKHGAQSGTTWDKESSNFRIDDDQWVCFLHETGGGVLQLIAVLEDICACNECGNSSQTGVIYRDNRKLLKTCLYARDKYSSELDKAKPPYDALVAVAKQSGLNFADPENETLGEDSYRLARTIYETMAPEDVEGI